MPDVQASLYQRSIPAWGGETRSGPVRRGVPKGPSPRGRGNPWPYPQSTRARRSIPAWAGKPFTRIASTTSVEVHPRVGGETTIRSYCPLRKRGPSPRGRGNLALVRGEDVAARSIPAWAGKPWRGSVRWLRSRVHPRVGGETADEIATMIREEGPSPRGRGNPKRPALDGALSRSIPAWAGKPQLQRLRLVERKVHPRVGGETVFILTVLLLEKGPSPRGRGKPVSHSCPQSMLTVHPRVGGENH